MEHIALYRQFRPMTFDEVVEQEHAVLALRQSILSGQIAHAYLFSGTRGTGKTTIAKIFSRAINCVSPRDGNPCNECDICKGILDGTLLDVIEMDAASNNSVDNIRRICDEVLFMPSKAKYKVYIVDEVHMLSAGAFNALLKTLEEPPSHAVFILATTEPHRIPATIISRCQRYDFRRIPIDSIVSRLRKISDASGIRIDNEALLTIAGLSDGALRDAISLLDQVSSDASKPVTRDDIIRMTGVVDDAFLLAMADAVLNTDASAILSLCEKLIMDGRDILRFSLDLAHYFRDLLVISVSEYPENLVRASSNSLSGMRALSARTSATDLLLTISKLSAMISELKWSPDMRTSFEISLLALSSTLSGTVLPYSDTGSCGTAFGTASAKPAQPVVKPTEPASPAFTVPVEKAPPPVPEALKPDDEYAPPDPEPPIQDDMTDESGPSDPLPLQVSFFPETSSNEVPQPPLDYSRIAPSTPNLTRAADTITSSKAHATNLSKVTAPSLVRDAKIPLPPEIPEEDFLPPPAFSGAPAVLTKPIPEEQSPASLTHLWDILLKRWEDTMFSDVLQLRLARIMQRDGILWVVFPDSMSQYARQLTQRSEYKRIREDSLTLIAEATELKVITESQEETDEKANRTDTSRAPSTPEWVQQMISYAQDAGIEVNTVDEL